MKKQAGFTIIEVMVSLVMVGVLLVLYASALNVATLTRKLKYENYAYHIANKQVESLRATTYGSLPPSGTISDPLMSSLPSSNGDFTVTDYPGFSNIKEIVVTINWNDGIAKQLILRTLAGSGGINP